MHALFGVMMFLTSLFLILLILVQRGRGGGLAGALGGMGGQSAFGTKAGDQFTKVTMIVAGFWIVLSLGAIVFLNSDRNNTSKFGTTSTSGSVPASMPEAPAGTATHAESAPANGAAAADAKSSAAPTAEQPATTAPGTPPAEVAPPVGTSPATVPPATTSTPEKK